MFKTGTAAEIGQNIGESRLLRRPEAHAGCRVENRKPARTRHECNNMLLLMLKWQFNDIIYSTLTQTAGAEIIN